MRIDNLYALSDYLSALPNGTRIAIVYHENGVYYQCRFNRVSNTLSITEELKHAGYWLSILKEWQSRSFGEVTVYHDRR